MSLGSTESESNANKYQSLPRFDIVHIRITKITEGKEKQKERNMLYLGKFSFFKSGEAVSKCSFTCLCEAASAEASVETFKELIMSQVETTEYLGDPKEIYCEDIVEIESLPKKGIMSHLEVLEIAEEQDSLFCTLPMVEAEGLAVLSYGSSEETDENADEEDPSDAVPFIAFE